MLFFIERDFKFASKISKTILDIAKKHRTFYNIGVNYQKADVKIRGMFSISEAQQNALLKDAKNFGIKGLVVLSTCNRTELTGFAHHPFELIMLLCKYSKGSAEIFGEMGTIYKEKEAVKHLFEIAAGLKSQILGDYEIVAQLKKAFKKAKNMGTLNTYLERLSNAVLQASKKIKTTTQLSKGTTSVSYATIRYIQENIPDFKNKRILMYGLGKIGKQTCIQLKNYTDTSKITLINRTYEKASHFAKNLKGMNVLEYGFLKETLEDTDILIVATSAQEPTITLQEIPKDIQKMVILDLSIPQNVCNEVVNLSQIHFANVDTLSKITDKTIANRIKEIPKVEKIIETHKEEFTQWLTHRKFIPAVNALKDSLVTIKNEAIDFQSRKQENFNATQAENIARHMIQKITTQFVKHLKAEDTSPNQSIALMEKIFDFSNNKNK